ncbi:hypothetical protein [Curvivirga aplysinae]|uniref:hypothetical protein n=1 Tax=Curvivirga aplysinae TaxID=2529852 RepID=UPI0012BC8A56|nr:hypothetical protein [Curvivirga aplysinae]MTI10184.1 hypothetical protein [Curvivirga aplysinae]
MPLRFDAPYFRALDATGAPIAGAKLYFYKTGTSTPKNTFTEKDLKIANTHPVIADANGLFGSIWLESGDYKVILKTAEDLDVWSTDPYSNESSDLLTDIDTENIKDGAITQAKLDPNISFGSESYLTEESKLLVSGGSLQGNHTVLKDLVEDITVDDIDNTLGIGTNNKYNNGDVLRVKATTLPTGITAKDYYVINATTSTIQISETFNGDPVVIQAIGAEVDVYKPQHVGVFNTLKVENVLTVPEGSSVSVVG